MNVDLVAMSEERDDDDWLYGDKEGKSSRQILPDDFMTWSPLEDRCK